MTNHFPKLVLVGLLFILPASAEAAETMCTEQYQPVCGGKQVQCIKSPCYPVYHTYGNSCTMNAEGGYFIHEGECTEAESGFVPPARDTYTPPKGCVAWFDGCNSCSLTSNGQTACTLMACLDKPAPGRCTRYEDTPAKPPVVAPTPSTPHVVASTSVNATTTTPVVATTTTSEKSGPGFVHRLWLSIRTWFSWL